MTQHKADNRVAQFRGADRPSGAARLPPRGLKTGGYRLAFSVFGACAFGAPAVAHERCRDRLLQSAAQPWSQAYIEAEIRKNPLLEVSYGVLARAIDDWRNFRIVTPTTTFSQR